MVIVDKKWRGSFTVEATIVISVFCMLIAWTILLGFYGHDRAVMKNTANQLALKAALWSGRYVSPIVNEIDYGAMRKNEDAGLSIIETEGYKLLQKRLLYGTVQSVSVSQNLLNNEMTIEVLVNFKLWKIPISCNVQASCCVFDSEDLPRNIGEIGEEE